MSLDMVWRVMFIALMLAALSPEGVSAGVSARLNLPDHSPVATGYDNPDSVISRLSTRQLLPAEGLWEMTADGTLVAIERVDGPTRSATNTYRLTLVICADRSIPPGTLLGYAVDSPDPKLFDTAIYTKCRKGALTSPQSFSMAVTDNGALTLRHYQTGYYIIPWRLLPYGYRYLIGKHDSRPDNLDGMVRVYPEPNRNPRVL